MGILRFFLFLCFTSLIYHFGLAQIRETPKKVTELFNMCYENKNDQYDSLSLKISGVYLPLNKEITTEQSQPNVYLFFNNGLVVSNFNLFDFPKTDAKNKELIENFVSWINRQPYNSDERFRFFRYSRWGLYQINRDTLRILDISKPSRGSQPGVISVHETLFQIGDNNNLCEIKKHQVFPNSKMEQAHFEESEKNRTKIKLAFYPLINFPPAEGWPLYEEWFWCDKEEYAKWKVKKGLDPKLNRMPSYKQFIKDQIKN